MSFFTYLVECSDGTFYCGYTDDLDKRIQQHNSEKSKTKYTRVRQPVKLVYSEKFETKSQAMKREAQIKKFSRQQKEKLLD